MEKAWRFIWDRFFDRRTYLFYDYLVGGPDRPDAATWHLPPPELIRRDIPNPCGHGTGMEDSVLTAGTAMDTVAARYRVTEEEEMRSLASDIYRGMELCMDISSRPGFVARSVSPADRTSHYTNSSRDQYTHWVWGAWTLFHSPLSDPGQKDSIREHLSRIAAACERDVRPENGWNLLREDGEVGIVSRMWGELGAHEYLRLPMFYAAAWKVTGDGRWDGLYQRYRAEAYERSLPFEISSGRTYIGLQMQYSLRLLWEAEEDAAWKGRYLALMERLAKEYEAFAVPRGKELLKPGNLAALSWLYRPWDRVRAAYTGFYGGKAYYNPGQSELPENRAFYPLRTVGECAAIAALCPGYRVSGETLEILEELLDAVDYENHHTYAPLALLNAYWRIRASRRE